MTRSDQLTQLLNDLSFISTESALVLGACTLLVAGLLTKHSVSLKFIFILVLAIAVYLSSLQETTGLVLSNSLMITRLNSTFSLLFILISGGVILFPRDKHVPEFYFMILSLLVGSLFMMKANSLLVIYLGVELVSFTSYILTNFSFRKASSEAAIKYLLFGAVSSAMLLIGLGFVYGSTGSFYLSELNADVFQTTFSQVGLLFIVFGVFFKASIFPFHIWTPAVYQSAPIDAVAIFSVVPKLSGLILLYNVCSQVNLAITHWITGFMIWMGIFSIVVGTLGAIMQSNTRRMIAFGSIAHSGFLLAFLITSQLEFEAFWFYAVVYAIMNMGAFYLIHHMEANNIFSNKAYSMLEGQSLLLISFAVILISLVGIPPLAGFTAKFFLFSYLWESYQHSQSPLVLSWLLISVFATVIALFYYLRIPYFYFLKNNATKMEAKSIEITLSTKIIATLFGVILLLLFFAPKLVVQATQH